MPARPVRGAYGVTEVGEGSRVPVLGSIANALYDAVGVGITELPITPERVLVALRERWGESPEMTTRRSKALKPIGAWSDDSDDS